MKVAPADLLQKQFDGIIKRGSIIRFLAKDLADPAYPDGKTKFAIVLNQVFPASEILYVFTTSNPDFYNKNKRFEAAIIRVPAATYGCFPLDTIIPFRDVYSIEVGKLKEQYVSGRLTFCGELTLEHLERMDAIIKDGWFVSPRMQKRILPPIEVPSGPPISA